MPTTNITNAAETNVITTNQMAKAREVDFVNRFSDNILRKLIEALGVTRKIPMMEGTTLNVYKTTGTLQSGVVPEGEIIPLSQYERIKSPVGEITIKKWRKAVTAEAIKKSGYNEAVNETDAKMLSDIQTGIRSDFFGFLNGLDGTVVGASTLQAVLAKTWGQLQVLFENDAVEVVHFMNPLTIADYLATAQISMQTAFGMNYVEDFLGMGTVILNSQIPVGHVISTAKENIIMYYLTMNGEVAQAFNLTADESGYIGVHNSQTDNRAQIELLAMSGITFLVEYADGVVLGQIDSTPSLGSLTVVSAAGTAVGDTALTVSGHTMESGESYKYKTGDTAPSVAYGQNLKNWTSWDGSSDITAATGKKITVAVVDANYRAQAAGNTTVTAKA